MDLNRLTDPEAYKQALAGLLRRGKEVGDYIEQAPTKAGQAILDAGQRQSALMDKAFDPTGNTLIRDSNAANQAAMNLFEGPMSFAPAGITAFHGTPHLIKDKFDISKVGTGEGAQSYGHGMYFAENPSVAKSYLVNAQSQKTPEGAARSYVRDYPSEKEALIGAKERLQRLQQNGTPDLIQQQEQIIKALESNQLGGNLYKVDIPDEYIPKMLNWDIPLNQQTDVLESIKTLGARQDLPKGFDKALERALENKNFDGQDLYYELTKVYKDPVALSKAMEESGFKGIRYLDQGSRSSKITNTPLTQLDAKIDILKKDIDSGLGNKEVMERKLKNLMDERARTTNQTSNFVVFEPSTVKILERNNQPISRKELLQEQIDKIAQ
jgi:hypothetical protein